MQPWSREPCGGLHPRRIDRQFQVSSYHRPGTLLKLKKMGLVRPGITGHWSLVDELVRNSGHLEDGYEGRLGFAGLPLAAVHQPGPRAALPTKATGTSPTGSTCSPFVFAASTSSWNWCHTKRVIQGQASTELKGFEAKKKSGS